MASSSPTEGSTFPMDDYEALLSTTDVELLKRAWRNEKAAPEILRFETDLIDRIREQIQLMEETVEEKSAAGIDPLSISLYQMDLDRAQFLLRSYLRVRIQKIEKHMFHIAKTDELWNKLSKEEKVFTRRKGNFLFNFFELQICKHISILDFEFSIVVAGVQMIYNNIWRRVFYQSYLKIINLSKNNL